MLEASRPFVVFSLPRSRSAWASVFLSTPTRICAHDLGPRVDTLDEFVDAVRGLYAGTCETGAAFAWPLIRQQLPEARFAVIRRDPAAVIRSLEALGITGQEGEMWGRARDLDRISAEPGTLTIDFDDLQAPWRANELYEHCTGRRAPMGWAQHLGQKNIQVDLPAELALLSARRPKIEALKRACRELLADA